MPTLPPSSRQSPSTRGTVQTTGTSLDTSPVPISPTSVDRGLSPLSRRHSRSLTSVERRPLNCRPAGKSSTVGWLPRAPDPGAVCITQSGPNQFSGFYMSQVPSADYTISVPAGWQAAVGDGRWWLGLCGHLRPLPDVQRPPARLSAGVRRRIEHALAHMKSRNVPRNCRHRPRHDHRTDHTSASPTPTLTRQRVSVGCGCFGGAVDNCQCGLGNVDMLGLFGH